MATAFRIRLDGDQQVGPGPIFTGASGLGTAVYDDVAKSLEYTMIIYGLDFNGATADPNVTGAHFHGGARGATSGVIFDWTSEDDDFTATLRADGSYLIHGLWEDGEDGDSIEALAAALGSTAIGADMALYANIHTAANVSGEIRGQLVGLADDNANNIGGTKDEDYLYGLGGADTISGKQGNDIIEGGALNDSIDGNLGSDTAAYTASPSAVTINLATGAAAGGHAAGDSFTSVENLLGSGFADTLTGSIGANVISGGLAGDTINGNRGRDVLIGGPGSDKFLFNTAIGPANLDRIADYNVAGDTIRLENAIFAGLPNGVLANARFFMGAAAHDPNDRIIYNPGSGALIFDTNGNAAGGAIKFAMLPTGLNTMTAGDFFVV